jgi:hypothetical protein
MFDVQTAILEGENFFAGSFPVATDFGTIKNGAEVRARTPVIMGDDGIEEAAADTLDKLIGITADVPSGNEVVIYLTGEFFTQAITLPTGVTAEALKPALRNLSIFLKEMKNNG